MTKQRNRAFALAVPAALAMVFASLAPAAAATAPGPHHAGRCHASGTDASCSAGNEAIRLSSIHVHIEAVPDQKVTVYWDLACSKGSSTSSDDGQFTRMTPFRHALRLPVARPDDCFLTATAELAGLSAGHYVSERITYWRW